MSEADAEWFTPDDRIKPRPPYVTPRPIPPRRTRPSRRPRPSTDRPDLARPISPNVPSEEKPISSLSKGSLISITVISCLIVVAIILALLYWFAVRKRLQNKPQQPVNLKNEDYSIRIEDVAHRKVDDSDELYVNTKDLHRLATSLREKKQKEMPTVSQVLKPNGINSTNQPAVSPQNVIQSVPVAKINPIISRPAPCPPTLKKDTNPLSDKKPLIKPKNPNIPLSKSIPKPNIPPPPVPKLTGMAMSGSSEIDANSTHTTGLSIKARRQLIENALSK